MTEQAKQYYVVKVKVGDKVRTLHPYGKSEGQALGAAQRICLSKYGMDRADFHTNKISIEKAENGLNFSLLR